MNGIEFAALALAALLAENFILVYCMGMGIRGREFIDPVDGRRTGISMTLVMVTSGMIAHWVDAVLVHFNMEYLELLAFALIVPAVSVILRGFLHFFLPELSRRLLPHLRGVSTNAAGLGSILLASQRGYDGVETFVFTLFGGIGLTLVMMCFAGLREEVNFESCPKCFRGLPIMFITGGLMALGLVGFYGLNIS